MDPFTLISIAKSAAEFVPAIGNMFDGGDDDKTTAQKVIELAGDITGNADPVTALSDLRDNPALRIHFQQAMNPVIIARLENETRRMAETNATMRAELNSSNKFKSYWRPAFGWALLFTWTITMLVFIFVLAYVVIDAPANLGKVLSGIAQVMGPFSIMWGVALSVLGISISKRSQDKAMVAGHAPALGILGALTQRLGGRSG